MSTTYHPTEAEMTKTQANGATIRARLARAVDLEPPLLLVNKVTGRLELAAAAQKVDGTSMPSTERVQIVVNDLE